MEVSDRLQVNALAPISVTLSGTKSVGTLSVFSLTTLLPLTFKTAEFHAIDRVGFHFTDEMTGQK